MKSQTSNKAEPPIDLPPLTDLVPCLVIRKGGSPESGDVVYMAVKNGIKYMLIRMDYEEDDERAYVAGSTISLPNLNEFMYLHESFEVTLSNDYSVN